MSPSRVLPARSGTHHCGCGLIVDGQPARIGRTKILELVACLSLHPRGIDRFELQRRLFPEADQRSGGNHFRQIAHKLRHTTNVNLERKGNLILVPTSLGFTPYSCCRRPRM